MEDPKHKHEMDACNDRDDILIKYKNCRVLKNGVLKHDDIWVKDGSIIDPMMVFYKETRMPDMTIDCNGLLASPGFIDLQVNGAFGIDFSSFKNTEQAEQGLLKVSEDLLKYGVTSFCPTLVTSSKGYYNKILPVMKFRKGGHHGACILGVHAEGPFINNERKGAHDHVHIQSSLSPTAILDCYGSLENVRIITLAPELPGAMDVITWLQDRGVVIALGHSMAKLDTAEEAVSKGASLITHLFNAMLPFHHRDPGIVGLLTSLKFNKQIYYSLISDGWHTHETVQRIAQKSNPEGTVLVTDSMAAMGLCEGTHMLGDISVEVKGTRTYVAGTNSLAGSVAKMDGCVREFLRATACGIPAALEAASLHPAMVLKEEKKGRLFVGSDADIVFLSEENGLTVCATAIAGKIVWKSENCPINITTS